MMGDFHYSARRAAEGSAAAASVEVEARVTGGGPVPSGSTTLEAATGLPEGAVPSGSATPQAATGGGLSRRAQELT
jgi:hypothetical protein